MKSFKVNTQKGFLTSCFVATALFVGGVSSLNAKDYAKSAQKEIEAGKEKVKEKFHEATDAVLDKDKINETVDQVADYLDKDKMKATVDEIADYFDKDRIKATIDMIADYLDKEKIKDAIDMVAEHLDREKIKTALDTLVDYLDKDQIKDKFDRTVDRTADSLQKATEFVKGKVAELGTDLTAIQKHLDKYDWKGLVSDKATYDVATLSQLKLNGHNRVTLAKPGEQIKGEVLCSLNREKCAPLSMYRVVVGIKEQGGRTTVCNHFGLRAGKEKDSFVLTAPQKKGIYQVGFRVVKAALESTALNEWDEHSSEPAPTIGLIVVN